METTLFRAHFTCPHPEWARCGHSSKKRETRQNVTAKRLSVPTLLTVPTVDNFGVGTKRGHAPAYNHNTLQLGAHMPTLFSLKTPEHTENSVSVLKVACTARCARRACACRNNRAKIGAL